MSVPADQSRVATASESSAKRGRSAAILVVLASLAMAGLGIPDGLQGVAWPSMSGHFGVSLSSLGVLLAAQMSGYVFGSAITGRLLRLLNPGTSAATGTATMALSLLGFALAPAWWLLLLSALTLGMGAGAVDGALNVYAALKFSARSTNWMHAFYGTGAIAGPTIMTAILVSGRSWQVGYSIGAAIVAMITITIGISHGMWGLADGDAESDGIGSDVPNRQTLRLAAAWLGILAFVVYTGIEVTVGQWTFTVLTRGREVATGTAGTWVAVYYLCLAVGRLGLGSLATFIPSRTLLWIAMTAALFGTVLFWTTPTPWVGLAGIAVMGLSFGPIFPLLISTTPARVGKDHTPNLIGFQIAAAGIGAGLLPGMIGWIAVERDLDLVGLALLVGTAILMVLHAVIGIQTREPTAIPAEPPSPM